MDFARRLDGPSRRFSQKTAVLRTLCPCTIDDPDVGNPVGKPKGTNDCPTSRDTRKLGAIQYSVSNARSIQLLGYKANGGNSNFSLSAIVERTKRNAPPPRRNCSSSVSLAFTRCVAPVCTLAGARHIFCAFSFKSTSIASLEGAFKSIRKLFIGSHSY